MAKCVCYFDLFLLYSKKARKLGPKLKYLRQAYHHWSKNCHPDKHLNTGELEMATEAQKLINQAYATFCSYDGTYKYISSGKPSEEFPHDCQALRNVIDWVHQKVKIREGEDLSNPGKQEEGSSIAESDAHDTEGQVKPTIGIKTYSKEGIKPEIQRQTAKDKSPDLLTVTGGISQLQVSSSSGKLTASLASDGASPISPTTSSESPEVIVIKEEEPLDLSSTFSDGQPRRSSGRGRKRRSTDFVPSGYQLRGGRILFNKHRETGAMYLMEWHRKPGSTTWLNEHVIAEFFPIEAKEYLDRLKANNSRRLHTIIRKAGPICAFL